MAPKLGGIRQGSKKQLDVYWLYLTLSMMG